MTDLGKILIGFGLLLLVAGAVVLILGRLPGDISWRNRTGTTRVYFPIVTCIILSVFFSLVMWAINHFRR